MGKFLNKYTPLLKLITVMVVVGVLWFIDNETARKFTVLFGTDIYWYLTGWEHSFEINLWRGRK